MPCVQGYISDERMNAAYREAKNWHKHVNSNQRQRQREILERQRQNKERQEQQEEDRELLIDDSAVSNLPPCGLHIIWSVQSKAVMWHSAICFSGRQGNDDEEQDIYESYRSACCLLQNLPRRR